MPSSPRQPLKNARMRQLILYINTDFDVPTTNGLHCGSPPAGHETDCRRAADGERDAVVRQFILYINADCDVPTTNGLSALHCCSSPAGADGVPTECRRSASQERDAVVA